MSSNLYVQTDIEESLARSSYRTMRRLRTTQMYKPAPHRSRLRRDEPAIFSSDERKFSAGASHANRNAVSRRKAQSASRGNGRESTPTEHRSRSVPDRTRRNANRIADGLGVKTSKRKPNETCHQRPSLNVPQRRGLGPSVESLTEDGRSVLASRDVTQVCCQLTSPIDESFVYETSATSSEMKPTISELQPPPRASAHGTDDRTADAASVGPRNGRRMGATSNLCEWFPALSNHGNGHTNNSNNNNGESQLNERDRCMRRRCDLVTVADREVSGSSRFHHQVAASSIINHCAVRDVEPVCSSSVNATPVRHYEPPYASTWHIPAVDFNPSDVTSRFWPVGRSPSRPFDTFHRPPASAAVRNCQSSMTSPLVTAADSNGARRRSQSSRRVTATSSTHSILTASPSSEQLCSGCECETRFQQPCPRSCHCRQSATCPGVKRRSDISRDRSDRRKVHLRDIKSRQSLNWLTDCDEEQCDGTSKSVEFQVTSEQNDDAIKEYVVSTDDDSDSDDKMNINYLTESLAVFRCNLIDGDELIRLGGNKGDGKLHYDLRSSRSTLKSRPSNASSTGQRGLFDRRDVQQQTTELADSMEDRAVQLSGSAFDRETRAAKPSELQVVDPSASCLNSPHTGRRSSSEVSAWTQKSRKLVTEIDSLLLDVKRKVQYDGNIDPHELCRQINDELECSAQSENIREYPNRLARFCKNIDYFIESQVAPSGNDANIKKTSAKQQSTLRRRAQLYEL